MFYRRFSTEDLLVHAAICQGENEEDSEAETGGSTRGDDGGGARLAPGISPSKYGDCPMCQKYVSIAQLFWPKLVRDYRSLRHFW